MIEEIKRLVAKKKMFELRYTSNLYLFMQNSDNQDSNAKNFMNENSIKFSYTIEKSSFEIFKKETNL